MTFNEIKKLLQDSGEDGILFELPKFRSNERLYLDKNGELYHVFYGDTTMHPTELMSCELSDDNWMPRGWQEMAKPIVKSHVEEPESTEVKDPRTDGNMTVNELYEFMKTWEPTQEQIDSLCEAVKKFDDELAERERRTRIDDNWLNKRYNM